MINLLVKKYLRSRYKRLGRIRQSPMPLQSTLLDSLIHRAKSCEYGRKFNFSTIQSYSDFARRLPIVEYEDIKSDIHRMMLGEPDILWPGSVRWFAKSSGTTNEKSKFIPVTNEKFKSSHVAANWDMLSNIYHQRPESLIFAEKNLVMGGALQKFEAHPKTTVGDVSAIMIRKMPYAGRPFYTPDIETALLHDWEEKLNRISEICPAENVVMIGGVPTWTIVLFRKILEKMKRNHILEVWPNLKTYIHGGVGFGPYRDQFKEFLPSPEIDYVEVYNASEGVFAIQDTMGCDELLLMLDNGIYFEFLPAEEWNKENPEAIPLRDVELGKNYGLIISSCAGLWRYMPGDTVVFTCLAPYRIQVSGRTKHYINAFGEELMVSNADKAIALACDHYNAIVKEYTAAPVYFEKGEKAGHQWAIEFSKTPQNIDKFGLFLDKKLQELNSDYEAKRYKNLALGPLKISSLPNGSFVDWMKQRGKAGGQHKVPRLSNDRTYMDDLLKFVNSQSAYANR